VNICIQTLGCKVNQYETQALETIFTERGHSICTSDMPCDAYIVNTCAVTAESGRKSRQAIRHAKRQHPGAIIAVCGCFSQIEPEEMRSLGADLISGSGGRVEFADALEQIWQDRQVRNLVDDPRRRHTFESLPAGSLSARTRAMLKIQDGCSNFCSYCIIPYTRGPVRSLPLEKAAAEAARLNAQEYRELVITGIEISSYGRDFNDGTTLIDVISAISTQTPHMRLRLGSLEPRTATDDFCRQLAALPNICNHFHLSMQSGCDATLSRMRRKYTSADFFDSLTNFRRYFPGCGITTDMIVGFPGETEAEFEQSLQFIQKCHFSAMHIFPYSPRPGTPAAEMPGQVDKRVKHLRARRAAETAAQMEQVFLDSCIGKTLNVLFEQETAGHSTGHAENYCLVSVEKDGIRNEILPVLVTKSGRSTLFGKIMVKEV
jgi:threonylcarbamoyladenosine tRNA methylthiotransferase MtaB